MDYREFMKEIFNEETEAVYTFIKEIINTPSEEDYENCLKIKHPV